MYCVLYTDPVYGAGPDNFAGKDEVGGGPPEHVLLPVVYICHLADLLLPDVSDHTPLGPDQAQYTQEQ